MKIWKLAGAAVVGVSAGVALGGGEDLPARLSLLPGDAAPALEPTQWVQGREVEGLEAGQVYVVDFWATWCGPCIAAMGHLTEVQAEHPESVTVIAVNIWENEEMSLDERVDLVRAKVRDLGDKMKVRTAIDGKRIMEKTWMRAAGSNGIPTTFIIDQGGRIAWIGHPMEMEEPLAEVLAGRFDVDGYRAEYKKDRAKEAKIADTWDLLKEGKPDEFQRAAAENYALMEGNAGQLNALAWEVTTNKSIEHRDMELAYKAAKRACVLTDWEDAFILDTYAHVLFARGDAEGAAKWESKAIEFLEEGTNEDVANDMKKALVRFKGGGAT